MKTKILIVGAVLLLILLYGCSQQLDSKKGVLEGKVTIGPLCPNYQGSDTDPKCQPTAETYKARPLAVFTPDRSSKVASIEPAEDGTYQLELQAGNYVVDLEKQDSLGTGALPATVTINPGETTTLDIDIDTGIR